MHGPIRISATKISLQLVLLPTKQKYMQTNEQPLYENYSVTGTATTTFLNRTPVHTAPSMP